MLAGCGDVKWFPESNGSSASPNAFNFNAATPLAGTTVIQSDAVTVTGTNQSGWPVTVTTTTANATSTFAINGSTSTTTILPNQSLQITQTLPSGGTSGEVVSTLVQVGTFTTTFTSTFQ
jgi:hypothetical protein